MVIRITTLENMLHARDCEHLNQSSQSSQSHYKALYTLNTHPLITSKEKIRNIDYWYSTT